MFLKINKRKITIYCLLGGSSQHVQTGTTYNFSLAENKRVGAKITQTVLAALASYTLNEYEPIKFIYKNNALGMSTKMPVVNSFDVKDETSFKRVKPEKTIRFYHTFTRNMSDATSKYEIPPNNIQKYYSQAMQIIPIYTKDEYKSYIKEEVQDKLKHEVTSGTGNVDKLINGTAYEICDYVVYNQDGSLTSYRNNLSIHVNYDFKLM